jgi:hypothetical protein
VGDDQLLLIVQRLEGREARMEAERAVEIERAICLAGRRDRERATQGAILRIGIGRDGGEPIHRAAQHDHDQPRIGRCRRQGEPRVAGAGEREGAESEQEGATIGHGITAA